MMPDRLKEAACQALPVDGQGLEGSTLQTWQLGCLTLNGVVLTEGAVMD